METLILAGTVSRDAELRRTQSGDPVLNFSIVIDQGKDRDGNRRDGHFYDASVWGKRAEALSSHITKGKKLTLSGRPTVRVHEGKAYQGISVDQLTFMGGPTGQGAPASHQNPMPDDLGDEIPFTYEWRV